ncbi:glycosyltransferase [Acinetobacter pittii]|uniref:glycosyltransferase n=1 Tax=Acinetobacter pittii TaxID=48296 RepID=UPI00197E3A20|nr:glycosyltransferase [Acinetobacter pittii]MBN6533326.1 glycosyltransferase [Acinetobacter pittii]
MISKVLFFLPTLGGGGAERTIIQLANSLVEQGLNIDLAVCNLNGESGKLLPELSTKIQLINLNCGRVANALLPLKNCLQEKKYDCVIATQTHTNIICVFAKKLANVKTKLILREVSTPSKNIKAKGLSKFLLKLLVNFTYSSADNVVCVSNGVLEDFRKFYNYNKDNLITIYNPVIDDVYFQKLEAPVQHRFLQSENKILIAVGRLTEAKNFAFLIRSFQRLYQQHKDTRLIILGEGELRSELESLIKELGILDVVDLVGFDPNPYAYFKHADLFVLSSNWEGLPGVLIQALASKVKVISTNCPSGPMEILANSKFGLLVDCNDIASMTLAMKQAIFGKYVEYSNEEFESHCIQFQKNNVLHRYLEIMEK